EIQAELRALSLSSKAGLFASLSDAWDLASARRKARRKSKVPLMVITLSAVACLSMASVLLLLGALKNAESEINRLEQSRRIVSEISLAEADFITLGEAAKVYYTAIFLNPAHSPKAKSNFQKALKITEARLDKVEASLKGGPYLHKFKNRWRPALENIPKYVASTLSDMEDAEGGASMDIGNLSSSLMLSKKCGDGVALLQEMTVEARKSEQEQLGEFKQTEAGIRVLAFLCTILNGSVVISLILYFARGTPQKLKKLAAQASELSRAKGLSAPISTRDELADLDSVLHELATALSESEEREKILLQKLQKAESEAEKVAD
ncbi:MAG: hypothetical protein K2X27_14185, partial [Candidatus Obscuribacterales bacterium]|nr:hypothetical protein [Candidatus Obscuribacterales bacterium]